MAEDVALHTVITNPREEEIICLSIVDAVRCDDVVVVSALCSVDIGCDKRLPTHHSHPYGVHFPQGSGLHIAHQREVNVSILNSMGLQHGGEEGTCNVEGGRNIAPKMHPFVTFPSNELITLNGSVLPFVGTENQCAIVGKLLLRLTGAEGDDIVAVRVVADNQVEPILVDRSILEIAIVATCTVGLEDDRDDGHFVREIQPHHIAVKRHNGLPGTIAVLLSATHRCEVFVLHTDVGEDVGAGFLRVSHRGMHRGNASPLKVTAFELYDSVAALNRQSGYPSSGGGYHFDCGAAILGGRKIIRHANPLEESIMIDYEVRPVSRKDVREFIEEHHYSHNINGLRPNYCFGMFSRDGTLVGAMMYRHFAMAGVWKKYAEHPEDVIELRRLVLVDDTPRNAESYFIKLAQESPHLYRWWDELRYAP